MGALNDTFKRSIPPPPMQGGGVANAPQAASPKRLPPRPDAIQASALAKSLASLGQAGLVEKLSHQEWAALGQELMPLDESAFKQATQALKVKGILLVRPHPALLLALDTSGATALVEAASQRVRMTSAEGDAKLYTKGQLSETITLDASGAWATLKREGRTERWNLLTGEGEAQGKAIVIPTAKALPGEAPRKLTKPKPNRFQEPKFGAYGSAKAYAKAFDAAVVKAGGRVVEALVPPMAESDLAPRYNCHSFATTGGKGDLADPFLSVGHARWLNFPFFQLREQGYEELAPSARVHVGDVILYRDGQGVATHTGLVREVDSDGNPSQVESKFGAFGLYVHAPNDVPAVYGEAKAYYRKP